MTYHNNLTGGQSGEEEQEDVSRHSQNEILKRISSEQEKLGVQMPTGPDPNNLTGCYDVGDIGPAGGIIVATPNSVGNNTQYYYELSPNDLHQNHHIINMSCPGSVCPIPICEWGSKGVDFNTECIVGQGKNNTNNAGTPNNQYLNSLNAFTLCTQYSLGGYDDWFLPSKDEWGLVRNVATFLSSINITTFNDCDVPSGGQNDPCSLNYGTLVPYWSSSAADPSNINYSQCTPYTDWSYVGSPDNHKAIVCTISGDYKIMRHSDCSVRAMRRFTCPYVTPGNIKLPCYDIGDITPQGGMIFAIPYTGWNNTKYYYEVGPTDLHTGGTPLHFQSWSNCDVTGNALVGAEWGLHGNTAISTSIEFGDGYKNTILIDAFPTGPNNPYLSTRDIAASICLNYGVTQQHVLEEGEEWFLPSLYEMWYMYTTVGPGTAFGTTLNLSESQIGSLASGAMTNDGWYWTSSQYSAVDADNPGQFYPGNYPSSFPGEENYAWAFINASNLSPSQPPLSLQRRCHASSVRPVRRFECEDTITQGGIDYNWRNVRSTYPDGPWSNGYGSPGFGEFQAQIPVGGINTGYVHMKFGAGVPYAAGGDDPNYDEVTFKYNTLSAAGWPMQQPNPIKNQLLPWWPQIYFHCTTWGGWGNPVPGNWSTLYTVTIYDIHENLMGKWDAQSNGGGACGAHAYCQRKKRFHTIVHIQGPDPIVQLTGDEYILIERKDSFSTNHKVNTLDLHNYAGTGTSIRMIDQFTNLPIPGPVPYWKACIEYCANNYGAFASCCSGCKDWGVSITPNQILAPDPPWWTPPHGTGLIPWSAAPGTPGNPFSTIGALKQDCSQLTSLTSGGACGVTTPWWYAPFTWVQSKISNPYSKEEEGLLAQDCSKDSSYFTERDDGGKHLTPSEQLNLISKKLNKFAKRIKNKFR